MLKQNTLNIPSRTIEILSVNAIKCCIRLLFKLNQNVLKNNVFEFYIVQLGVLIFNFFEIETGWGPKFFLTPNCIDKFLI